MSWGRLVEGVSETKVEVIVIKFSEIEVVLHFHHV
jgi:hypothetical protein